MVKQFIYRISTLLLVLAFGIGLFITFNYFFQMLSTFSTAFSHDPRIKMWLALPSLLLIIMAVCNYPILYFAGIRLSYLHHKQKQPLKALLSLMLPALSIGILLVISLLTKFIS